MQNNKNTVINLLCLIFRRWILFKWDDS